MKKAPLKPANIMKVCDLYPNQISDELLAFIELQAPEYKDTRLSEHLYCVESLVENADGEISEKASEELFDLRRIANDYDAGYIRLCEI